MGEYEYTFGGVQCCFWHKMLTDDLLGSYMQTKNYSVQPLDVGYLCCTLFRNCCRRCEDAISYGRI